MSAATDTSTHPGAVRAEGGTRHTGWGRHRTWVLPLAGLALALVFLAPYIVMVLNSLRPSGDVVRTPPTFLPREWQLSTYAQVLGDERFLNWLKTSLIVAAASTVIVILVSIPAAYYTARFRFPGRMAFLLLVLVTRCSRRPRWSSASTASGSTSTWSTPTARSSSPTPRSTSRSRCGSCTVLRLDPQGGRGGREPRRLQPLRHAAG